MPDELTQNITGWLHNLISSERISVTGKEVDYINECRKWLAEVNQGQLVVVSAERLAQLEALEGQCTPEDPPAPPVSPAH